jgi:3-phenylpropionate/trans-cinnamate dioxygenase ferredoxin subunit
MPTYVHIATFADLPPNSMRGFVHGDLRIAVYRIGENLYATDNVCSHEEADLTDGWLEADDCTVECPLHGARFSITSGQALSLPAYRPVAVYAVRIDGERVLVELP